MARRGPVAFERPARGMRGGTATRAVAELEENDIFLGRAPYGASQPPKELRLGASVPR